MDNMKREIYTKAWNALDPALTNEESTKALKDLNETIDKYDNIIKLAELRNILSPCLKLITLIIDSYVFDSEKDKNIILKIYHIIKNELEDIKNRNDIQKIKLLLCELEMNAIGSKAEYCKWKNITDTEWSTIGHITSCTDFNKDNTIPIKYKHCPLCGKEIDIAY